MNNPVTNVQDKILECKDLRVSFKTNNGTVKAVRGVSFNLYRGRTLAIVGESGSGKSVTSKAIMGILAGNKIIEDGHILFDGHDLLKLTDRQYTDIRGSRISMIFQDPMSSLNPIMRVGKQMTEALILKNQSVRETSGKAARALIRHLKKVALLDHPEEKERINKVFSLIKRNADALPKEDYDYIVKIFDKVGFDTHDLYIASLKAVVSEISEGQKTHLASFATFNPETFKDYLKTLASVKKRTNNPLADFKDDLAFTFHASAVAYLKRYHRAKLEVEKAKNVKDARDEKIAQGVDTARADLKKRSFGSEFLKTPEDVYAQLQNLFSEFVAHLNDILLKAETEKVKASGKAILDKLSLRIRESKKRLSMSEARKIAISILEEVGIQDADRRFRQYPFELSGGMRQRIVIAIALLSNPDILICDEPTTALDVTIQAQILDLINKIKNERKLSVIFITHNLGVVANMADDIAVMYAGKIVEFGGVNDVFYNPKHPYTWALLSSMPDLNTKDRLESIPGTPPNMIIPPKGDAFAARNKYALKIDFEEEPPFFEISTNHFAATWLLHEDAPKVTPPKIVLQRMEELREYTEKLANKGGTKDAK